MLRVCIATVCVVLLACSAASAVTLRSTSWCAGVIPAGTTIAASDGCGAAVENAFVAAQSAANIIATGSPPDSATCFALWAKYTCTSLLQTNTLAPGAVHNLITGNFSIACGAAVTGALGAYWDNIIKPSAGLPYSFRGNAAPVDSTPYLATPVVKYAACEPYAGSFCSNFVPRGAVIYVPSGSSQAAVEGLLVTQAKSAVLATNCTNCRNNIMKLLCNTAFPKCDYALKRLTPTPIPVNASFFNFPSQQLCTDTRTSCAAGVAGPLSFAAWSTLGSVLGFADCSATVTTQFKCNSSDLNGPYLPLYTFPSFPSATTVLNAGPVTLPVNTGYSSVSNSGLNLACPFPIRKDNWCSAIVSSTTTVLPLLDQCGAAQENAFNAISASMNMIPQTLPDCRKYWAQWTCTVIMGSQLGTVPQSVCSNLAASCGAVTGLLSAFWANVIRPGTTLPAFNLTAAPCTPDAKSFMSYQASPVIKAPQCELYTGNVCKNFIPSNQLIYVPAGFTQASIEGLLAPNTYAILLADRKLCRDKLLKIICNNAFPKCSYPPPLFNPVTQTGLTAAFFNFPDRSVCLDAQTSCSAAVSGPNTALVYNTFAAKLGFGNCSALTVTGVKCNSTDPTAAYVPSTFFPSYPNGRQPLNALISLDSNTGYPSMPQSATPAGAAIDAAYLCPEPTSNIPDSDTSSQGVLNTTCSPRCPSLLYTADDYKKADVLMGVMSGIGLACQSLLMFTYAAFKKTRRSYYTIYFSANLWLVSMCLFFGVAHPDGEFGRYAEMRCKNRYTPEYGHYCLFQGLVMVFTGLSAVAWWFLQSLDLYLQIRWNARKWGPDMVFRKNICYYIWGWGWPACALIAVGASNNAGNAWNGIAWCFIVNTDVSWGLFYGPVGAQCFFGAVMMGLIILSIYQSSTASGAHKRKGWWRIYIRPLIFVAVFLVAWSFVFAYRFSEHFNEDKYADDAKSWILCVLQTKPAAASVGVNVDCNVKPSPALGLFWLIQADIAGVGIWGFLVYNTNENFVMWYHYLLCKKYNFSRTTGDSQSTGSRTSSKNVPMTKQPTKRGGGTGGPSKGKSTQNLMSDDTSSTAGHSRDPSNHSLAGAAQAGSGSLHYGDPDDAPPVTANPVTDPPSQV